MDIQPKKPGMAKKSIIIIAVLILILAAIIIWQKKSIAPSNLNQTLPPGAPGNNQLNQQSLGDTTGEINQDLEGVNVADLEQEFKNIDADLNNL